VNDIVCPPGQESIIAGLHELGYSANSLAELRQPGSRYRKAIPFLVDALSTTGDRKTLQEIVLTLSKSWAKPEATRPLIDLFQKVDDRDGLQWAIGSALCSTWDDSEFDDLVRLAKDRRYGRSREMIVLGLARSKRPEAGDVLIGLLDDPDVNGHAVNALRKLKVPAARAGLEKMLDDPRTWVRKEARRALEAIS